MDSIFEVIFLGFTGTTTQNGFISIDSLEVINDINDVTLRSKWKIWSD